MTDILELPFDQYQRYGLVQALLESVRAPGEQFHVLDVGGRTALLRSFLPDDRVDLVDVDPSDVPGLILGSGAQLPFADDAFDVVAAFDTLEHVPPALREAFVAECGRVARRYVMLAGPYDAPRVAEAEEILLQFLRDRLDWEHRYLAEHRSNGLPDAAETTRGLEATGARVRTFGHGALDRWLLLMSLELYIEHEGLLHDVGKRAYRFYNEHLFRTDHGDEVYRHAIVAAFGDAPMPSLDGVLEPPGSAPREASETLIEFGREILRYDAHRTTFEPEMARLHAEVRRSMADVEGHRSTLEAVEADLVEHKSTVEALRAELAQERDASAERLGVIEADLVAHRETVAELQRIREGELTELQARAETIGSLENQGNELRGEIQRAREHLEGALVSITGGAEHGGSEDAPTEDAAQPIDALSLDLARAQVAQRAAWQAREEAHAAEVVALRLEIDTVRAQLAHVRANQAGLAAEANRFWARVGRGVSLRKLDPSLLDDGSAVTADG